MPRRPEEVFRAVDTQHPESSTRRNPMSKLLPLCILLLAASTALSAQTYTVLHNFRNVSGEPNPDFFGRIAQSRGGAMLTTSRDAYQDYLLGKAFRVWTDGTLQVLHQFDPVFGNEPESGFTLAIDGQYYGTTVSGGAFGYGTIFKMSQNGTVTKLYDFTGGSDGANPYAAPIQSVEGDFYGTSQGCCSNYGSVYRITKYGNFTLLHAFTNADGRNPFAELVQGTNYYFYGMTMDGGAGGNGTIYRVSSTGDFKVLVNFWGTNGSHPSHGLIQASDGNFYGVTGWGGSSHNGVLFRMKPDGSLKVLHNFTGGTDGGRPIGSLVQGSDGNLYGTNTLGGRADGTGFGVIFRATLAGDVVPLYAFSVNPATGVNTICPLLQHTNGKLYGETNAGGAYGLGGFYSLDAGLPPFVTYLPTYGRVGALVQILGQGFTDASEVFFNGTPATYKLVYPTYIRATVPDAATTGPITVTTTNGTLTSNKLFIVHP